MDPGRRGDRGAAGGGGRLKELAHSFHRDADIGGQLAEDHLFAGPFFQESGEDLKLIDILNLRKISQILPDQLLTVEFLPALTEALVAFKVGIGKTRRKSP